jgi:hypothetical protein
MSASRGIDAMPEGLVPTFKEIADELLEWLHHDARLNEIAEPFMAGLPIPVPGVSDAWRKMQRRAVLFAEAQRVFAAMAPREAEFRAHSDRPRSLANVGPAPEVPPCLSRSTHPQKTQRLRHIAGIGWRVLRPLAIPFYRRRRPDARA